MPDKSEREPPLTVYFEGTEALARKIEPYERARWTVLAVLLAITVSAVLIFLWLG